MSTLFNPEQLKKLYVPPPNSSKGDNGQVAIIGGSKLFHGAPLLALTVASRIVDMVFFASPEPSVGRVAEQIKSKLFSFIWVPWNKTAEYVEKSEAVLIGPGLMRTFKTRKITKWFLTRFPDKKWVIDAGSLQMMEPGWIPPGAVLTPNHKEFKSLFGEADPKETVRKYKCTVVLKGRETIVFSPEGSVVVKGGNAGLTKGGSGDVQAGLTVAFFAKNDSFLAASSASYLVKRAGDELYREVGINYSADDLARALPRVLRQSTS